MILRRTSGVGLARVGLVFPIIFFGLLPFKAVAVPIEGPFEEVTMKGTFTSIRSTGSSDPTINAIESALLGSPFSLNMRYRLSFTDPQTTIRGSSVTSSSPSFSAIRFSALESGGVSVTDDCVSCPIPLDSVFFGTNGSPSDPLSQVGNPIGNDISDIFVRTANVDLIDNNGVFAPYAGFPDRPPSEGQLAFFEGFRPNPFEDSFVRLLFENAGTGKQGGVLGRIDSIAAVPEPGHLSLLFLGIFTMLKLRFGRIKR